jgi:small subunit ribosomal protein S6
MGYKPKGGEIMNKYESVIIINPSLEEEGLKSLIQKFTDLINTDGKVESVEEMGKRKLAYEVKKNKEAYYVLINFEANPELITELERNYRITDDVIKFIVVKKEN